LVRLFYSETKSGSQSYDRELQRELKWVTIWVTM
jgi:hypothetical protein